MKQDNTRYFFVGGMREDYFITHDGQVYLDILGGNAIYSAMGARLWSDSVGIVSRIGSNYPAQWIETLENAGFDTQGIVQLPQPQDTRTFYAYTSEETRVDTNPAAHFLHAGQPLPKELIDYRSSTEGQDERKEFDPLAIRPDDLPISIRNARAVHLSPAHYLSHTTIPLRLQEWNVPLVTIDPSERYMDPAFRTEVAVIIRDLSAFLPSMMEASAFFRPAELDIWEMAEAFGEMGCPIVVIKCGAEGQYVWDQVSKRRSHIPAYPARIVDVTGAGDAYCGGFLVGLAKTGDPIEAALYGSISASITVEGIGPFYILDALPGLAKVRLDALRPSVRTI
jgi:sugar/nucleoside kinase (ribokinase family)